MSTKVKLSETILKHGIIIFVADDIYNTQEFLQKSEGVYSVKKLTLETLKSL